MSERRNFLKAASLLPLGVFGNTASSNAIVDHFSTLSSQQDTTVPEATSPPPPPPHPPIQEQHFPDYHLLGKPDPDANLFGEVRPQDWPTTKHDLQQALKTVAAQNDPIHQWLNTFSATFDHRAAAIVIEAGNHIYRVKSPQQLKYEPELYESCLRGAAALLDRCLRYRNEMGGFELAGVSAGMGYLTFIKLKPLQRNFLIHSNSADLAKIEQTTEAVVGHRYRQVGGIDKLFERRQLQAKVAEAEGSAEEAGLAEAKDNFLSTLLQKQFHFQVDAQLAQFTRLLSPGSSANFAERYLRMLAMLKEDLSDAFCKLYSASKGMQAVLGLSKVSVAMNVPIDVDIPVLKTMSDIQHWVEAIVPSEEETRRNPDILDALVLWTRAVMRELDARSQYEIEFTASVPLNQPWGKAHASILKPSDISKAFGGNNPTGSVTFTLPNDSLPIGAKSNNVRVVGVGLSVEHSQDDAVPLQFITNFPHTPSNPVVGVNQTPAPSQEPTQAQTTAAQQYELPKMARLNATIFTPAQVIAGVATYSRPPVFLPNVRVQGGSGGDFEPALCYDLACRGLLPFGSWTISLDPNAIAYFASSSQLTDNWITGLVLHLRLRATME